MTTEAFDIVIPLYRIRWNTQAVMEGLTYHYQPRSIHIVAPSEQVDELNKLIGDWDTAPIFTHKEEVIFVEQCGLTKDDICNELDLGESLYTPGWFYQQLLKLGAYEGIKDLTEWYFVWDSDLLPVATWPLTQIKDGKKKPSFALIQHNGWGNPTIVGKWEKWINTILKVEGLTHHEGTFIPHHMCFKQEHLKSLTAEVNKYYESDDHWLKLMMRSANEFGTFSEYWCYVSWVAEKAPDDLSFYPYDLYGSTTERFFDDGTGLFSKTFRSKNGIADNAPDFSPNYKDVEAFIKAEYGLDNLPSSLSFESSPRHLKKDEKNMHIEELRSRWNPRQLTTAK